MPMHKENRILLFLFAALIPGHLFNWVIEWAFAAITTMLGIAYFSKFSIRYPRTARLGLVVLLAITTISIISYTSTLIFYGFPTGIRDAVELLKPAMIFFSCTLVFSYGPPDLLDLRKACLCVAIYSLACGALTVVDVPVLSSLVNFLYSETKTGFSEFLVRMSIPFENPNYFGIFSVFSLIAAINFSKKPDLMLASIAFCAIGLSGSRTAWLTAILVLAINNATGIIRVFSNPREISASKLTMLIFLPALLIYNSSSIIEIIPRMDKFIDIASNFDFGSDASYAERQDLRSEAIKLLLQKPFFGFGAVKYSNLDIVDNQYFSLMLRFGILGVVILLSVLIVMIVQNLRVLSRKKYLAEGLLTWLVLFVWLWTGTFLENIRVAIIITTIFASLSLSHEKSTC